MDIKGVSRNFEAITISEVMVRDIQCVSSNSLVSDAAKIMVEKKISSVLVKDGDEIIGIVTDKDFVSLALHGGNPRGVRGLMSNRLVVISPDADLFEAFKLMMKEKVRHLVVKENGGIVGIITTKDIIRGVAASQLIMNF